MTKTTTHGKTTRLFCVLGLVLLLVATGITGAGAEGSKTDEPERPPGVMCDGFAVLPGIGPACPAPGGLLEVFSRDGESLGFTHGGDPAPEGGDTAASGHHASSMIPPKCTQYTSDYRTVVIYAHAYDDEDRWAKMYWDISDMVVAINTHLRTEADPSKVQVDLRVPCNTSDLPHVFKVTLPTSKDSTDFSSIVTDMRNMGYNDPRHKYMVYYDHSVPGSFRGIGHGYNDDRRIVDNYNNGGVDHAMFGVSFGYLDLRVMMHEHGHTMGAVQNSSPNSTGRFHCIDGDDIMCYDDGGPRGNQYSRSVCNEGGLLEPDREFYDCNKDDYFNPAPAAGSYLADHWNIGWSGNRFLAFDGCGLARERTITAPGAGLYIRGVSWYTETGIDPSCGGRAYALKAVSGGDFDLCFFKQNTRLGCSDEPGDESGTIPYGTTDIRVYLYFGTDDRYVLYSV